MASRVSNSFTLGSYTFNATSKEVADKAQEFIDEYLMFLGFEPIPDWDEEQKKFYAETFGE